MPSLSVQRSLRGSAIKTIRRAAWMCAPNRPGVRQAYETSPSLHGRADRAVEFLNVTSPVIGLGLRDARARHVCDS